MCDIGPCWGLKFPSFCRNPICSTTIPSFIASQSRCATCRSSLRGVQWIDAVAALDLHRRIEDANDHESGEIKEEDEEEAQDGPM